MVNRITFTTFISFVVTMMVSFYNVAEDEKTVVVIEKQVRAWINNPVARLLRKESYDKKQLLVVLGDVKKIHGQWISGADVLVFQPRVDFIYEYLFRTEIPALLEQIHSRIAVSGATLLRTCSGRHCGNSSFYANEMFGYRTLYGRDDDQAYSVWIDKERQLLWQWYIVLRGGETVVLLARAISLDADSLATFDKVISGNTSAKIVSDISQSFTGFRLASKREFNWSASAKELARLQRHIQSRKQIAAYLVLYQYQSGQYREGVDNTQLLAQELLARLKAEGADTKLMMAIGAGAIRHHEGDLLVEWVPQP